MPGASSRVEVGRSPADELPRLTSVQALYEGYVDFVWRNLLRLGIPGTMVEDAVQDVFLVVHRRLKDFESRSSVQTWLFGIVLRVAQTQRRTLRRRRALADELAAAGSHDSSDGGSNNPVELVSRREASQLLHKLLDELDDDKRAILVSVELEQMSVADAAEALGVNLNTAHTRLRAARRVFQDAVNRQRSAEEKDLA